MRALVTGGAGFIGSNLIKRLLKDGHQVMSIDNYSSGSDKNEIDGCRYYKADVSFDGLNLELLGIEVIFHLAALSRIKPSMEEPSLCLNRNFNGTLNILEYARKHKIQVIYAGSCSKHHGLYDSPYAWSKYSGEGLCKLYSKIYDLNTTICRFYNVYGLNQIQSGDYSTVVGIFTKQYRNKESLTITGTGKQKRDFIHVNDVADGLVKCMGKDFRAEEFEFGTGRNYSINEVAGMFGKKYPKEYIEARDGEYDVSLCTDKNARKKLKWKTKTNLRRWLGKNK